MNRNLNNPSQMTRRSRIFERLLKLNLLRSNQAKRSLSLATQRKEALQNALALFDDTTSKAEQIHTSNSTQQLLTSREITASLAPYKLQKTNQLLTITGEHTLLSQQLCSLKSAGSALTSQLQTIQMQQLAIAEHLEHSDIEDNRSSRQANTNGFQ